MEAERDQSEMQELFIDARYSRGDVILLTEVSQKALEHTTKPEGRFE